VKELEMRLETTKKSTIRETFNYDWSYQKITNYAKLLV